MKTYAAYYDNEIRNESSSGGIFSLLASQFDVIYGVEMDEVKKYAIYARKTDDISSLRGSKYIQAQVGDSFRQVKLDLFDGRRVLFIGTACQVNGLHAFLRRDFSNLMTVDVICHGVPTAYYWQKYIEGKEICKVNFRAKNGGWENYTYGMLLNDTYIPCNKNKYMTLYVKVPMLFTRKEECCGCTACKAICPQHAISMVEDEEGFDYPRIEENKCVGCYQCIEVCPIKISLERKKYRGRLQRK